jgi:hypothetical protein
MPMLMPIVRVIQPIKGRAKGFVWLLVAAVLFAQSAAYAQEELPVGKVVAAMGQSFVLRNGDKVAVSKGMEVFRADQLVTSANSVVRIVFADGSSIIALKDSSFEIEEYRTRAAGKKLGLDSVVGLVRGKIRVLVKPRDGGHNAVVKTKNAVMGVRGTEFFVSQEGGENDDKVTNLVVIKGAVAFAPLDDDGNIVDPKSDGSLDASNSGSGGAARMPEVLVRAGEESRIVAQAAPSAPVVADVAKVTRFAEEAKLIAKTEAIPDSEVTKSIVLPPPPMDTGAKSDGASESRLMRKNRERFLALDPSAAQADKGTAGDQKQTPAPGDGRGGSPAAQGSSADGRTIVVIPRAPTLLSEIGLACDGGSLQRLRSAAQVMDPETMTIGNQLVECDELQDEVYFWQFVYLMVRGEAKRAAELMKSQPAKRDPLDLVTAREQDLKLFRKKDVAEILRRAGKSKGRDRSRVLLAARAAALAGSWDQSLALYDESLGLPSLLAKTDIVLEKVYVLMLKENFDRAAFELEALDAQDLMESQRRAVAFAFESIRRNRLEQEPVDKHFDGFFRTTQSSDSWAQSEFGVAWQGQSFFVDSALGNVQLAKSAESVGDRGEDFGYSRLGLGVRTKFSTGAKASVHADLYGKEKGSVGARMLGEYPVWQRLVANIEVSTYPQFTEFVSAIDQVNDRVLSLGWGLRGYDVIRYFGSFTSRDSGGSTILNGLRGNIPVHRTGLPNKKLDVVLDARSRIQSEQTTAFFAPKSEFRIGGGAEWTWSFWRSFDLGVTAIFGYVSRKSFGDQSGTQTPATAGANTASTANTKDAPWTERERIPSAVSIDTAINARYAFTQKLSLELEAAGAFENGLEEPSSGAVQKEPSDKAKNTSLIHALLGLRWDYGSP